jgi:hypothetical protein
MTNYDELLRDDARRRAHTQIEQRNLIVGAAGAWLAMLQTCMQQLAALGLHPDAIDMHEHAEQRARVLTLLREFVVAEELKITLSDTLDLDEATRVVLDALNGRGTLTTQLDTLRNERERVIMVLRAWIDDMPIDPFLLSLDKLDERDLARSVDRVLQLVLLGTPREHDEHNEQLAPLLRKLDATDRAELVETMQRMLREKNES